MLLGNLERFLGYLTGQKFAGELEGNIRFKIIFLNFLIKHFFKKWGVRIFEFFV